jgi:hypothetical protein
LNSVRALVKTALGKSGQALRGAPFQQPDQSLFGLRIFPHAFSPLVYQKGHITAISDMA